MTGDNRSDSCVRPVERPRGGKVADLFVAVRVAEHHLLDATPAVELAGVDRVTQEGLDDRGAALECLGGLEPRDDVDVAPRWVGGQVMEHGEAGEKEGCQDGISAF